MLRYKINKISEVKNDLLSEFYKKIYQKRHNSLTNNWRWWYRVGYNEFEPIVLLVDNKIIGHAGLLPIDLNILEKKIPAIWFVDYAILSKFQGKGYGQILTKEWMKICPNQITFCNNFRVAKPKLRCLSLPGCAINDEILTILSPALVTVSVISSY